MFRVECIQSPMSDDSYDLAPTPRRVLTNHAVDSIRNAILSGKIRPGARPIDEDHSKAPGSIGQTELDSSGRGVFGAARAFLHAAATNWRAAR